jgi:hypothetical protein
VTAGYEEAIEPDQPTPDQIVEALRAAGWLLEQETEATLRAAGYHSVMGFAFPDPDDPAVSREIDVTGYRQLCRSDDLAMSVGVRVIAECKQSSMPYVLVGRKRATSTGRPRIEHHLRFDTVEIGRTPLGDGRHRLEHVDAREYVGIRNLPGNPWDAEFVATQMTRLDRKKTWLADNKGIFTSLVYPLAKALTYFRSQNKRGSYVDHRPGRDWAGITFYYPIVVTSAPIYVVNVGDDPPAPERSPWATMTRQIKAKNVDGQFYVDVVSADSVADYLAQRVGIFADAVAEIAAADPQRFVTHQDHSYVRPATPG